MTDTAANRYRAAGEIDSLDGRHRLLLFALLDADPLDTLDEIDIRWPRATAEHVSVDAFRGITAAGPWGGGISDPDHSSDSQFFTIDDPLPLCPAGDLLFTAVSTPSGTNAQFDAPWHVLPRPQLPGRNSPIRSSPWPTAPSPPTTTTAR